MAEKSKIVAGGGGGNATVAHQCGVTDSGTACAQVGIKHQPCVQPTSGLPKHAGRGWEE